MKLEFYNHLKSLVLQEKNEMQLFDIEDQTSGGICNVGTNINTCIKKMLELQISPG